MPDFVVVDFSIEGNVLDIPISTEGLRAIVDPIVANEGINFPVILICQ